MKDFIFYIVSAIITTFLVAIIVAGAIVNLLIE